MFQDRSYVNTICLFYDILMKQHPLHQFLFVRFADTRRLSYTTKRQKSVRTAGLSIISIRHQPLPVSSGTKPASYCWSDALKNPEKAPSICPVDLSICTKVPKKLRPAKSKKKPAFRLITASICFRFPTSIRTKALKSTP